MLSVTSEVAQRVESAEALDGVDCAEALARMNPEAGAAAKAVAGGFVMYVGQGSPLTHALGIGMNGPVTAEQIEEIEEFFHSRESRINVDVCPYADPTLLELLVSRGYRASEFNNVMVRRITPETVLEPSPQEPPARRALGSEADAWAETVLRGFFSRDAISEDELEVGRVLFRMPGGEPHFALIGDEFAGAGSATYRGGVASLFADATLVKYRRQGVHRALIRKRLELAVLRGCDLATAGTQPGSGSQRDFEQLGFQVAYTKLTMTHE